MSEKKEKHHVRFVQNSSFWATWFIFLVFLIGGYVLLYQGNLTTSRYNARKNLSNLSLDTLHEGTYVEGTVYSTFCCYGSYDLKDYYVVKIGKDKEEYITLLSQTVDSMELEKLPTQSYQWQDDSLDSFQEAEEGYYICGIIQQMNPENFNYDYLERQLNTTDRVKINKMISPKYCVKLINAKNISVWGNTGKLSLFLAGLVFVFVVVPSYRKRVRVEQIGTETREQYRQNRQKTSASIKRFIENTYDSVVRIIFEHQGNIVQVTSKSEIHDILNCFLCANYDKVYDDYYIEQNDIYEIEFVMDNEDSISGSLNGENVILWYGNCTRMDRNSSKKVKTIFQSMEI